MKEHTHRQPGDDKQIKFNFITTISKRGELKTQNDVRTSVSSIQAVKRRNNQHKSATIY